MPVHPPWIAEAHFGLARVNVHIHQLAVQGQIQSADGLAPHLQQGSIGGSHCLNEATIGDGAPVH